MTLEADTQPTESSLDTIDGIVRVVYVFEGAPVLMNKAMGMHHRPRSIATAEWRGIFEGLAAGTPPLEWATVVVRHEHKRGGRNIPDVAATAFTVKAAIDGIVLAGVLPDDDPEHLVSIRFVAPEHTQRDAIIIELIGPAAA